MLLLFTVTSSFFVKDETYVKLEPQIKKEEPEEAGGAAPSHSSPVKAEGLVEVKQEPAAASSKRRREEDEGDEGKPSKSERNRGPTS